VRCKYLRRRVLKRWKQCKLVSKNFAGYLKVILASDSLFVVRGNVIHDTELISKPDGRWVFPNLPSETRLPPLPMNRNSVGGVLKMRPEKSSERNLWFLSQYMVSETGRLNPYFTQIHIIPGNKKDFLCITVVIFLGLTT